MELKVRIRTILENILRLDLHDDRMKQKAMIKVSALLGVESISTDMKDEKMTVVGSVDPVCIVRKLRKHCQTEVISVGPAKEQDKKEESKKADEVAQMVNHYLEYSYPYMNTYYGYRTIDENPNACVIC